LGTRGKSPAEAGWGVGLHQNHQLKLVAKMNSDQFFHTTFNRTPFESMRLYKLDRTLDGPKISVQRGFNR
jgi:hypothetical protein